MFLKNSRDSHPNPSPMQRLEAALNALIVLLGVALAGIGGTMTLKKAGIL